MYATEDECPSLNKPHYVTYPDGAYIVAKVNTIERVLLNYHSVGAKYGINYASQYSPAARSIYLVRRKVGYRLLCSLEVMGCCDALRAFKDGQDLTKLAMDN